MPFQSLQQIPDVPIARITTGIDEIDWLFGGANGEWGPPAGKITLLAGISGCGKSRATIEMARQMSKIGYRVIYFQSETDLSTFKSWATKGDDDEEISSNFKVSDANTLEGQLKDIIDSRAELAFVDSINCIEEFGSGCKSSIKEVINRYRVVCKATGVHVVFICQLNQDGTIKAATDLPHLVDIIFNADYLYAKKNQKIENYFTIKIGNKHRYGRTGKQFMSIWRHTDDGAECVSDNRLTDDVWCEHHGELLLSSICDSRNLPETAILNGVRMKKIFDPLSSSFFYGEAS